MNRFKLIFLRVYFLCFLVLFVAITAVTSQVRSIFVIRLIAISLTTNAHQFQRRSRQGFPITEAIFGYHKLTEVASFDADSDWPELAQVNFRDPHRSDLSFVDRCEIRCRPPEPKARRRPTLTLLTSSKLLTGDRYVHGFLKSGRGTD